MAMFDSVMQKNFLRPLTFKEAAQYGIDDLRRRQYDLLDFELRSWTSEMLNENQTTQDQNNNAFESFDFRAPMTDQLVPQVEIKNQQQDRFQFENLLENETEFRLPKVSVADMINITQEVFFIF